MAEEKNKIEEKEEPIIGKDNSEELKKNKKEINNDTPEIKNKLNGNNQVNIIKKDLEETQDRLKRVMAEFENYKKRNEKDKVFLYNCILSDVIISFLPLVDNLEKAVKTESQDEAYKQGIELLLKQMLEILKNFGVEQIESTGKVFDPELHEAVSSIQDETLGEKIIKEEFRKGYKIGSKVIRHAMVVVAN